MVSDGNLLPWTWGRKNLSVDKENIAHGKQTPYGALQNDMTCALEKFFHAFESEISAPLSEFSPGSMFQPRLEMTESPQAFSVSVELPGIDEKDLDVSIDSRCVTIKGDKREEKVTDTSGYYRMERHYGAFERSVSFPCRIDKENAGATFLRGVLTVTVPKESNAQHELKKIPVRKD